MLWKLDNNIFISGDVYLACIRCESSKHKVDTFFTALQYPESIVRQIRTKLEINVDILNKNTNYFTHSVSFEIFMTERTKLELYKLQSAFVSTDGLGNEPAPQGGKWSVAFKNLITFHDSYSHPPLIPNVHCISSHMMLQVTPSIIKFHRK